MDDEELAREVEQRTVFTKLTPLQKSRVLKMLQANGHTVGFLGDGINDAPSLAHADVGFAIGGGADIALESADIVLMRGDLGAVVAAIDLSAATLRKIRQNLFFAFFYNCLGIPLAALGYVNPVLAGAAMALSSVCVLSNSLWLNRWRPAPLI
ncbi:atpase p [Lasius niger]|uniref:Atpase p n=1 Tax=Lasius niger TaxID=67767 RepID=A0A0J7JZ64_LASNI|nr:atpase p [Lasius niger]